MNVDLTEAEWQQAIQLMSFAPARECMPFINKIEQRRMMADMVTQRPQPVNKGNGQEAADAK
jgi:hypothetical protein